MSRKRIVIFRQIITVLVLSLALVPLLNIKLVNAQTGQVTLKPTDDTYISLTNPDSNYGGQTHLDIEHYVIGTPPYQSTYQEIIWLKFDLSSIPEGAVIDNAILQLHAYYVSETYTVHACYCSDNSWTELGITWNNYPRIGFISVDSVLVATPYQWYNWSVLQAINYTQLNNLTAVTIALIEPSPRSPLSSVWFESKEAPVYLTDYAPTLTVHWSHIVPEFPTFLILPLAMATTLVAVVFYKFACLTAPKSEKSSSAYKPFSPLIYVCPV